MNFIVDESVKGYWKVVQNSEVYYKKHIGSKVQYEKSAYFMILQKLKKE